MRARVSGLLGTLGLLGALGLLLSSTAALAHSGGLDSYGCHHDRKAGGYHCHRGQFAGRSFGSQAEMLEMLQKQEKRAPAPQKRDDK
jgi:hypothetical protein